ncbi:hypothetical protein CV093_15555 [Oceanobacillus sp. 143]|uniref:Uncharacterized protein n=1 Tax=Oceanobacillus zhaokaii TaxID=2052660 RepID=A0A345PJB0_9BACI|nr:hypothetical protein [Oceanobacillus zhaokaii]AXI10090.1 hypothetical protein CUC15_14640 [Oceanobacillus zhaokaii]QGS69222.1 hypothetical protein CV093_15555 [Oceanobacillus sp. 143]
MEKVECERCPEFVPAGAPDDFCIPEECCPERIDQPRFPSPTSCLPQEQLEELEVNISEANQILLDLGLSNEREPNEIFQRAFDGLVGQRVAVKIDCPLLSNPDKIVTRRGRVFLVGFDFVVLRNKANREVIIPFEKIQKIRLSGRFAEPIEEEALDDIEPCFRRRLTFNFGETVASSPELIQIFFRLRLRIYLLLLVNQRIRVRLENKFMRGTLFDVHEETITLRVGKKEREIPINNICYFVVLEKEKK